MTSEATARDGGDRDDLTTTEAHGKKLVGSFMRDSRGLAPELQPELWRQMGTCCTPLPGPKAEGAGFDFSFRAWHLGDALLADWRQGPQRFLRGKTHLRADHRDHYALLVSAMGARAGDADGQAIDVAPGDVVILDLGRPVDLHVNPVASLCYMLPRDRLDEILPPGDRHGLILSGSIGRLLGEHLGSVCRHAASLEEEDVGGVTRPTRHLIAAAIDTHSETLARAESAVDAALLVRAKRYIEQHLHKGALCVEDIRRELLVSRSRLYRLFAAEGGVMAYVSSRRLSRAKAAFEAGSPMPVAQVAYRYGFSDEAHFSRAFRRAFKISPRECRSVPRVRSAPQALPPAGRQVWASWIESLRS